MNTSRLTRTLTAAALSVVMLAGCDSLLDIEPQQSIDAEIALLTPQTVQAALVGAYNALGDADLYGGRTMMLPDLLADEGDLNWTGTFSQPREIWNKSILIDNTYVATQWIDAYDAINIANNVLSALDVFTSEGERARVEGEARFVRGLLYFQLVRLYGRDWADGDPAQNPAVPLITTPTDVIGPDDEVERNTVAQVYAQVEADLTAARDLLPESNDIFAGTYAASAILSRVYLQQRRFEEAAEEADRVIESGLYELAPTFADAFDNVSDGPEYVFAIQITPQDGVNSLNEFYGTAPGRRDLSMTAQHLDRYEEDDARGQFFYVFQDRVWTLKWANGASDGTNIPVVRLAEMYLNRAEANLRGGTTIGADPVDDINEVRNRAGLDDLESVTIEDVMHERRVELAFEGHRLFDAKRNQEMILDIPWNSPRLVYPIPRRELDANPSLEQNPGYGTT